VVNERQARATLARYNMSRRHQPWTQCAYDAGRVPANRAVVAAIQRYDRNLFPRWNMISARWEMWRWRRLVGARNPVTTPPEEMVRRAVYVFTCAAGPLDWNTLRRLVAADRGTETVEQTARALDQADAVKRDRDEKDVHDFVRDWEVDNARQLDSLTGNQSVISIPKTVGS